MVKMQKSPAGVLRNTSEEQVSLVAHFRWHLGLLRCVQYVSQM